jgi:hypothetical protein
MVTAKALKAEDGGLGSAALLGCPQNPRPIAIQGSERFREGPPKLGDFILEAQRSGGYTLCISCRGAVLA